MKNSILILILAAFAAGIARLSRLLAAGVPAAERDGARGVDTTERCTPDRHCPGDECSSQCVHEIRRGVVDGRSLRVGTPAQRQRSNS